MTADQITEILKVAWPLLVIQVGLQLYALVDLIRLRRTKNLSVGLWAVIIIIGEIVGPILYLVWGRAEE